MANKNVLVGSVDPITGLTAHGSFVSGDAVVRPDTAPLVRTQWVYGDGSSGSATIATNTTLNANLAYEDLTIADGVALDANGYMLLVRGTLTMGDGSSIIRAAANASGSTAGAGGATNFYAGGSTGGNGSGGTGAAGIASAACFAGAGGKGGNSGASIGGAGGLVVFPFAKQGGDSTKGNLMALIGGHEPTTPGSKFPGGSGGGGGASITTGTGGGGGGGGRVLIVCANKIVIPAGIAVIRANGGNGANGVSGNGAGGGGGGGGVCVVISSYDMPAALTVLANGGAPGTGLGSGLTGVAGSAGFSAYYKWN